MNTLIELHWLHLNDKAAKPEYNSTWELSYGRMHNDNLRFSITAFHNESEIFSWDGDNSNLVGVIKGYGIEPEFSYRTDTFSIGINHSFYRLIDWDFRLKQANGSVLQTVSYSDMNYTRDFLTLSGSGNSLTNWANQQSKFWLDYQLNDNWRFHLDARIVWQFEYGNDLFSMYQNAYAAVDIKALDGDTLAQYHEDKAFLAAFRQTVVDDKDIFGKDIRLNASVTWLPSFIKNAKLALYSQNLINFTGNKRQKINFTSKTLPAISWIEEPITIGLEFSLLF